MKILPMCCIILLGGAAPVLAAGHGGDEMAVNLTNSIFGYCAVALFALAYILVIFEEQTHLRKSKPVMMAAGFIWVFLVISYRIAGIPAEGAGCIWSVFLPFCTGAVQLADSSAYHEFFCGKRKTRSTRRYSFYEVRCAAYHVPFSHDHRYRGFFS